MAALMPSDGPSPFPRGPNMAAVLLPTTPFSQRAEPSPLWLRTFRDRPVGCGTTRIPHPLCDKAKRGCASPLPISSGAPCEAGTAGPVPQRVVKGSQPTQCHTLGLARGSGPFEPPTGGNSPLAPPFPTCLLELLRLLHNANSNSPPVIIKFELHDPDK